MTWWKDLYKQLYENFDDSLNKKNIHEYLNDFQNHGKTKSFALSKFVK